jgi:hypothetical protein
MAFRDSASNITPITVIESSATNVSFSGSPKTVTSILLTPGTYIINGQVNAINTGNNLFSTSASISTADNTIQGAFANQKLYLYDGAGSLNMAVNLMNFRVVVASNTTYYLVTETSSFSGTTTLNGRITALKVA